jgi:hypothetical protein
MEYRKASPRGLLHYDSGSESSPLIKALYTKEVGIDRVGSSVKGMNFLLVKKGKCAEEREHPRCCTQSYRIPQLNLVDDHDKQLNGEVLTNLASRIFL